MKPTLKKITSIFIEAVKETPREMFAPLVYIWNAIKGLPSRKDEKPDPAASKKPGPGSSS